MFEEVFRIIFDRRHIKDVRLWVLIILVIAEVSSFYIYNKYVVQSIHERQERQGKRIRDIIKVTKIQSKLDALPQPEER